MSISELRLEIESLVEERSADGRVAKEAIGRLLTALEQGEVRAAEKVEGMGEGWITAVTHSPVMGHWIGLGFISGGHEAWEGKAVVAADPVRKGNIRVEIISPHMYDPKGEKMYG